MLSEGELSPVEDRLLRSVQLELERTYKRIDAHNDNTLSVIQYMILVFGGGIAATLKYPQAFAAVPVFWSVWFLHAMLLDYNTLRLSARAVVLESAANKLLKQDVYAWEGSLTKRTVFKAPIYHANYILWMTINATAWIVAVVFLANSHTPWLIAPLGILWVAVYGTAAYTWRHRSAFADKCKIQAEGLLKLSSLKSVDDERRPLAALPDETAGA